MKTLINYGNNILNEKEEIKSSLKEAYETLFIIPEKDNVGISTTGQVEDNVNAFSFLITQEESLNLSSNITDYVLEDNTMAQSGNTRQPLQVDITGIVGELFYEKPQTLLKAEVFTQTKLNEFAGISPSLSIKGQEYLNKVNQTTRKIQNVVNKVDNAFTFIRNFTSNQGLTQQQQASQILLSMWRAGTPFAVSTYYGVFENMQIKDLKIRQEDNLMQSLITMTLKQITYTQTKTRELKAEEITKAQKGKKQNNGTELISIASKKTGLGA